jgi:AI-2 transport protein TqsA
MTHDEGAPGATPASPRVATSASPIRAIAAGPLVPLAWFVLVLVGMLALREVASLLVPVLFGLFIALVAWPLVGMLERRGLRHSIALTGAILVILVIVLGALAIAALSVAELVIQVPKYETRLRDQLDALLELFAQYGIQPDPGAIVDIISPSQILAFIRPVASAASHAGVSLFVLSFTMVYALFGGGGLEARAREAFGDRHALITGVERFGIDLRRYLVVRAMLGIFAAVLSFILLLLLGVPFPYLWAFLVFGASFVPNIGTFIAVIPPTVMALLDGGLLTAVAVVVGYTLINFAQDHFLQPVVMGSELNLSPLVVFLSVLVWAWVLGAAGALLAVPLTVGLVAIIEAYPASRPVAALLRNAVEPRAGPDGAGPGEPGSPDAEANDVFTAPEAQPADDAGRSPG